MEKSKKKIIITAIVSIIISIIYELIMKYGFGNESIFFVDKIILNSTILFFINLHFVVGITKLYDFIIENRYKISVILLIVFTLLQYSGSSNGIFAYMVFENEKNNTLIGFPRAIHSDEYALETIIAISQKENDYAYKNENLRGISTDVFSIIHAPTKDILTLGRIYNLGHVILKNPSIGIAFAWNLKTILLILATFEFCYLITNKNKRLSITGTIIIAFCGFVQWWDVIVDILILGELAIVLLNKFMTLEKFTARMLCLIGMAILAISYIFTFYPPYMISFGYVFLALAIWIIIKNRKLYKISFKDCIGIIFCIVFVGLMCYRYFYLSNETLEIVRNTNYPGERLESGGNGIAYLFSYLYNFLLPYMDLGDNCSLSSIISIFPLPMIFAILYLYNKQEHSDFLLPLVFVAVLETIFCISGLPKIISEITLLKYVPVERVAIAVGFANVCLMLYIIANIKEEIISMKISIRISIILMLFVSVLPLPVNIATKGFLYLISGTLCMYSFVFLNYYDKRYEKVLVAILVIFTLVGAFGVNPITKGTYAVTETEFAKKIQEITAEDENAIWISLDNVMILANYAVANGAKTLNSTNTYPNKTFFEDVLGKEFAEEKKDIWNRYSHIQMEIGEKCSVELLEKDKIKLCITPKKMKELNIKYIITYQEKKELEDKGINIEEIYVKQSNNNIIVDGKEVNKISIYKLINN